MNLDEFVEIDFWDISQGYLINEYGDIYTTKINNGPHRLIKPRADKNGYLSVQLVCNDGKRRHFRVHRLVAKMYCYNENEEINNIVLHLDNDVKNNHFTNLKWGTVKENTIQAYSDGLCSSAKRIRVYEAQGLIEHDFYSVSEFSRYYNIPYGTVGGLIEKALKNNGYHTGKYDRLHGCKIQVI